MKMAEASLRYFVASVTEDIPTEDLALILMLSLIHIYVAVRAYYPVDTAAHARAFLLRRRPPVYDAGRDALLWAIVVPQYVPVLGVLFRDYRINRLRHSPSPPPSSLCVPQPE